MQLSLDRRKIQLAMRKQTFHPRVVAMAAILTSRRFLADAVRVLLTHHAASPAREDLLALLRQWETATTHGQSPTSPEVDLSRPHSHIHTTKNHG